jgi:hypothetical protein
MNLGRLILLLFLVCLQASPTSATPVQEPLKLGFYLPAIRDANLADMKVSLGIWVTEIGKPLGLIVTTATYADIAAMREALDRAEMNFFSGPGMELAEVFTPEEIRSGYARRNKGVEEGIVLLVSNTSGIKRFADLRNKRLSRLSNDRLSDIFLEVQCIKTAGMACRDFLQIKEEKRDVQSVYNVFFGRADAALVSLATLRTANELNPQVGQHLHLLLDWKAKALMFGIMTRHTQDSYRTLILNSVTESMKTPRGRQILELFKTDYLEPVDAEALQPYWALLREYNELRKTRPAKKP